MNRERAFQIVLRLVGLIFVAGIYPLTVVWPSGWSWHTGHSDYLQMILGVYAALGVFLLIASRRPADHRSLIAFAAWSSLVHAGIMAMQALMNTGEQAHLLGDVPALIIVGIAMIALAPKPLCPWLPSYPCAVLMVCQTPTRPSAIGPKTSVSPKYAMCESGFQNASGPPTRTRQSEVTATR